jgi:N-acetylneuraminate lyase
MKNFSGTWPALITPTAKDGGVNLAVLRKLTEYLVGKGIGGLYLCGSTGEGLLLSPQERMTVVENVQDVLKGRVPVIVHVGCVATRDAVALAKHAQQAGAAGVSSVLPVLGADLQSTFLHYQAIAAAAPDLPFFPYLFGARTDAPTLMRELLPRISNIGGAKYTGPNMYEFRQLIDMGAGRAGWTIFSGMDEQCVLAAMFGAPGNIGSTVNFMAGAYRDIHRSYNAGDLAAARDLQIRANRVTQIVISFGFNGALREVMRILGFDCGEPRLPFAPLPDDKRQALHQSLAQVGLAELAAL